ncbi:MAG: LD-carboxypeptidase [Erysipelotrichaceae bacterium]|nr:LD-carboxypeptidase [Erysipelotrichaceae bacterium]
MIYPKFLQANDTIGICPLSAGCGDKVEEFEESLDILKNEGYKIKITESVLSDKKVAASAKQRAKELDEVVTDKDVDFIMLAAGGDVQMETLPYINFEHIKENPKWITGMSDPTNLLYPVTTGLDIATIYGFNGGGYHNDNSLDQQNNLKMIKGEMIKQETFKKYYSFLDLIKEIDNPQDVKWMSSDEELHLKGRCIGGCIDVIGKLIGTEYDHTKDFIEKYKDDGIIWYFDNFALSAFNMYLTLLQMKFAGYFKYCKGVLIGRTAFPSNMDSEVILEYEEAYKKALEGIPYIYDMDIGHTKPKMTMINGALIDVKYKDHQGEISFKLQ